MGPTVWNWFAAQMPDLVICDVMLPGLDGFELCRRIKADKRTEHIPVLMLTAKAAPRHKLEGLSRGADDYLVKPFDVGELRLRVSNLIESRQRLQQHFCRKWGFQEALEELPSADQVFVNRVIAAIEQHCANPRFNVLDLAAEVGFSERQLRRKIKSVLGKGPADLIRRVRLNLALHRLEQKSGTVAEIAGQVGFEDPRYFSRVFQSTFGKRPSDFLKDHRGSGHNI